MILIIAVDSKNGIGKNGNLPWHVPRDMKLFRKITVGTNPSKQNAVIMGFNTWQSIPHNRRPLGDRINIVLTKRHNNDVHGKNTHVVTSVSDCMQLLQNINVNDVFVIGGKTIYQQFNNYIRQAYVTRFFYDFNCDVFADNVPNSNEWHLCCISEVQKFNGYYVRWEQWKRHSALLRDTISGIVISNTYESQYLELLANTLKHGVVREDRTGVSTISVFCPQMLRFDVSDCKIPLLTTKRVSWKTIIHELLWFLSGSTDARVLQQKGVHIWDGNSSREFLDRRGLHDYEEGQLGPIYGAQWRRFGADVHHKGVDQLQYIVDLIKSDPYSRRIVLTAWNPKDLDKMALLPCHLYAQFYVTNEQLLSLHFHMRSVDEFLGLPYNIVSYAILLNIIAKKTNLHAHEMVVTFGDAHIYKSHIDAVKTQLQRTPISCIPTIVLSDDVATTDFEHLSIHQFHVNGYFCHDKIPAPMAV